MYSVHEYSDNSKERQIKHHNTTQDLRHVYMHVHIYMYMYTCIVIVYHFLAISNCREAKNFDQKVFPSITNVRDHTTTHGANISQVKLSRNNISQNETPTIYTVDMYMYLYRNMLCLLNSRGLEEKFKMSAFEVN